MRNVFIAKGNGYQGDTTFDGFEIIAEPLKGDHPDCRILGRVDGKEGTGTDYRSHSFRLAYRAGEPAYKAHRDVYILVQHGGGREVMLWHLPYDRGVTLAAVLALPEAAQYGLLHSVYSVADDTRYAVAERVRAEWVQAYVDKRIRRSRPKGGTCRVTIEPSRLGNGRASPAKWPAM